MELVLKIARWLPAPNQWTMDKSDIARVSEKLCPSHSCGSCHVGLGRVLLGWVLLDRILLSWVLLDRILLDWAGLGWAGLGHITLHYVTVTLCHSLHNNTQNLALSVFLK